MTSLSPVLNSLFLGNSPFSRGAVDVVLVVTGSKVLVEEGSVPLKMVWLWQVD